MTGTGPVVATPLAIERRALAGPGDVRVPTAEVVTTGPGPRRSREAARGLAGRAVVVAGVAGALVRGLAPGDLVVADEVRDRHGRSVRLASAPLLAAALRAAGLTVHVGPVLSADHVVTGAERAALARPGAPRVNGAVLASDASNVPLLPRDRSGPARNGSAPPRVNGAVLTSDARNVPLLPRDGEPPPRQPLVVDTESAWLVPDDAPAAVVRAVVDTPDHPLVRPGTITRGIAALTALRRAAPAIAAWCAALGPREVLLAEPRSFCAGVDRAIATVEQALERHGAPVYVRRQIVHNSHVVADLERRGAVFVQEADEVPAGATLVLAAHGVAPSVRRTAASRHLAVVDATCPLVTKVHAGVRRHAVRGATVFLIGHAEHEEVEGTVGEAPEHVVVVGTEAEAETVTAADPARVASAVQTTLAVDEAERIAAVLRRRFPALAEPRSADICYATTNRQAAVRAVAAEADRLVVVGSANSSNSVRLAEVGLRAGTDARRVDRPDELDLSWLTGARRVALTAGASAPDHLVDGGVGSVVDLLRGLGPVTVTPRPTTTEDIHFTLPKEVS
ncbi:MAG TPA: 4-hydroxy-3-methylbut-2-enyl diphosphate reductase [Actinomycetospora sp.]|jgi:4-hydroxy-3-methylbut-2-enyl diphosphate reductase|uniref:4-hydroxy-3-methylbut-2-enyl diphosphate reductase n=1 Tax=Actinomycetospora sp. TaxID=1872135 RepID=UPI002F3F4919